MALDQPVSLAELPGIAVTLGTALRDDVAKQIPSYEALFQPAK